MLFSFAGALKPIRVQGAFVSSSELEEILNFIKDQFDGNAYDEEVLSEINRAASKCGKKSGSSDDDEGDSDRGTSGNKGPLDDPQFLEAVDVALSQGQISTALLQRRLSIGFGKAARFIDYMEDMGLVSEKNGAKPRSVLLSREDWLAKFDRVSI
jgi:S-DNA-T family DNA segregation ATPase FtsK/SpoIIIE